MPARTLDTNPVSAHIPAHRQHGVWANSHKGYLLRCTALLAAIAAAGHATASCPVLPSILTVLAVLLSLPGSSRLGGGAGIILRIMQQCWAGRPAHVAFSHALGPAKPHGMPKSRPLSRS